jgi:hypothetical protein
MLTGYISVSEFQDSIYYCAFAECCSLTGAALTGVISEAIDIATSQIDNYLGRTMWLQPYSDKFVGKNLNVYHTALMPVDSVQSITWKNKRENMNSFPHYNYTYNESTTATGTITNFDLVNDRTGLIEIYNGFYKYNRYTVNYWAGYTSETLPEIIKTATKILTAQISQMVDTGNLSNPDVSYENVKFDTTSFSFGAGKTMKMFNFKSIDEYSDLPSNVKVMLNKYKYSKRLY